MSSLPFPSYPSSSSLLLHKQRRLRQQQQEQQNEDNTDDHQHESQHQQQSFRGSSLDNKNHDDFYYHRSRHYDHDPLNYQQTQQQQQHHRDQHHNDLRSVLLSPPREVGKKAARMFYHHDQSDNTSTTAATTTPQPSFLTFVLMKMNTLLPVYCERLYNSNHNNHKLLGPAGISETSAAIACKVFDNNDDDSVCLTSFVETREVAPEGATTTTTTTSQQLSRPTTSTQSTTASPLSFKNWISSTFYQQQQHQQRSSLLSSLSPSKMNNNYSSLLFRFENEWETYIAPFRLLAGAEVLYSQLVHIYANNEHEKKHHLQQEQIQQQRQQHKSIGNIWFQLNPAKPSTDTMKGNSNAISSVSSLIGLYHRIDQELQYIQEILCEPFLRQLQSTASNSDGSSDNNTSILYTNTQKNYIEYASSLTASIRTISALLSIRCQLITLQALVFGSTTIDDDIYWNSPSYDEEEENLLSIPTYADAAQAISIMLQTVASISQKGSNDASTGKSDKIVHPITNTEHNNSNGINGLSVSPMLQSITNELHAWKYCFETCHALEQCKFMDTIISLRKWQVYLPKILTSTSSTITCSLWMNQSFQRVRSLLPIYFDRIQIHSNHSYGFNTSVLQQQQGTSDDTNAIVIDFLLRHEKLNTPPMAIGVLLDTTSTSNINVERGFYIQSNDSDTKKRDDPRVLWPAIYLRSTMHLPSPTPPTTSPGSSSIFSSSQASKLSNWALGSSNSINKSGGGSPFTVLGRKQQHLSPTTTPPSHRKAKTLSLSATPQLPFFDVTTSIATTATTVASSKRSSSALEYGPEPGTPVTSWPHCDWESIASHLTVNKTQSPIDLHSQYAARSVLEDGTGICSNEWQTGDIGKIDSGMSTILVTPLGLHLHLMVMIKGQDVDIDRMHQQRSKNQINLLDEVRAFMIDKMVPLLNLSFIFSPKYLEELTVKLTTSTTDTKLGTKDDKDRSIPKAATASTIMTNPLYLPTIPTTDAVGPSSKFWDNEQQVQNFLNVVVTSFGLRSLTGTTSSPYHSNNMANSNRQSSIWGNSSTDYITPRTPTGMMNRRMDHKQRHYRKNVQSDTTASAAMFFLGSDLASSFE